MKIDNDHLDASQDDTRQDADAAHGDGAASVAAIHQRLAAWGAGMRQAVDSFEADMQSLLHAEKAIAAAQIQAQLLAEERDAEIERLTAELRNARQVAADALVGKARDQLAIDGKDAQLAELRQQLERNVAMTAAESDARLEAQMELVGIKTERDNLAIEVRELRGQLDTSRVERGNLRTELEVLRGRA